MSVRLSAVLVSHGTNLLSFWCPGCNAVHQIRVCEGPHPGWTWNGNAERPTFTPSVLSNREQACPGLPVCHSFVVDGRIRFLSDSTHALAGQTVDLPPFPEAYE